MSLPALLLALALDLGFGDLDGPWQPVRLLGRLIAWIEARTRRGGRWAKWRGAGLLLLVLGVAWLAGELALDLGSWADSLGLAGWGGFCAQVFLLWSCLAARPLLDRFRAAGDASARWRLLAEGMGKGVLGPLFFAWLGGGPLAWAYHAGALLVAGLIRRGADPDALGWAAVRTQAVLDWIPEFLAALCAVPAAAFLGLDGRSAFREARRVQAAGAAKDAGARPEEPGEGKGAA